METLQRLMPVFCVWLLLSLALLTRGVAWQQTTPGFEQREEAAKTAGQSRHSQWPKVRAAWLKEHPACAACGNRAKADVQVHHLIPFHVAPKRELDPTNLITLCERGPCGINCHLQIGHSGSWQTHNPKCLDDVERFRRQVLPVLIGIRQHGIKSEPEE